MFRYFQCKLFSCCTFFMLHSSNVALFPYRTHFSFHYFFHFPFFHRAALFPCFTFFVLHSFHVALFSFYTLFTLLFSRAALFSCCSFSVLHYFHAVFLCCTLLMLHFLHIALFSCCTAISKFFPDQIFCRKFQADCLFFTCCANPVIQKSIKSFTAS